jgi:tetratricopeptide (TPR) repeat protein
MRNNWLTTLAAAFAAFGTIGSSAPASPAGMAASAPRTTKAPATAVNADTASTAYADALRPSARISPTKNPFKYFAAAMSEFPIGGKAGASANPVMQPAQSHNDAIALDKPIGPPTPELFIAMAQISEKQGNVQQARGHFGQALAMWPGHVEVLRAAARMEDRLGQLAMAETLYGQAVAANPQHTGALNDLGLCLARQGKLEQSVQVLEQAINLQPDKPLYRNNAATVLIELRQDQRALGHLVAVHGAAEANYNFGQLLVQRGRAVEATPYFQAAVDQNPQLQSAHVALAKLRGTPIPQVTTAQPASAPAVIQQTPPAGPQLYYPATARSPEPGASTYVPPTYYAPAGTAPPIASPNYGPAPTRYLPPVASQPGPMQR